MQLLGEAGLAERARIIMEKPFGTDLASAVQLNDTLHETFDESQIFRIDHFLGKEAALNILAFRFANGLFEPIWNRQHIAHVQIDVPETLSIGQRIGFYEKTGAYRDMVVNHLFQVLAFMAMEPPTALEPRSIGEEKNKVFRSLSPIEPAQVVRGQYDGYLDEPGVRAHSETETFIALRCEIDNWRWAGVPFYLRTGKRMAEGARIISIAFREPPKSMFPTGLGRRRARTRPPHLRPRRRVEALAVVLRQASRPGHDARQAEPAVRAARDRSHRRPARGLRAADLRRDERRPHAVHAARRASRACGSGRSRCSRTRRRCGRTRRDRGDRTRSTSSSRPTRGGFPSNGPGARPDGPACSDRTGPRTEEAGMAIDTFFAFIGVYDDVDDALDDYEAIKELHTEAGLIDAFDAAVVERQDDGKVKIVKKHETPTRVGGVLGGGVGLATGLVIALFPAAAIGGGLLLATTAGGALLGSVAGHAAAGMSRSDLKELGESLDDGQAGLVVVGVSDMEAKIEHAMKKAKKKESPPAQGRHRGHREGRQGRLRRWRRQLHRSGASTTSPTRAGRIVLVTGANSGIGCETALALAETGAACVLACRTRQGTRRRGAILEPRTRGRPPRSCRSTWRTWPSSAALPTRFATDYPRLDVLMNNAGVMALPYRNRGRLRDAVRHEPPRALRPDRTAARPAARRVRRADRHREQRLPSSRQDRLRRSAMGTGLREVAARTGRARWRISSSPTSSNAASLTRACRRSQWRATPGGRARTSGTASAGITGKLMEVARPLVNLFLQSAEMGALPTERAAVDPAVRGGEYYGPDGFGEQRGHPQRV